MLLFLACFSSKSSLFFFMYKLYDSVLSFSSSASIFWSYFWWASAQPVPIAADKRTDNAVPRYINPDLDACEFTVIFTITETSIGKGIVTEGPIIKISGCLRIFCFAGGSSISTVSVSSGSILLGALDKKEWSSQSSVLVISDIFISGRFTVISLSQIAIALPKYIILWPVIYTVSNIFKLAVPLILFPLIKVPFLLLSVIVQLSFAFIVQWCEPTYWSDIIISLSSERPTEIILLPKIEYFLKLFFSGNASLTSTANSILSNKSFITAPSNKSAYSSRSSPPSTNKCSVDKIRHFSSNTSRSNIQPLHTSEISNCIRLLSTAGSKYSATLSNLFIYNVNAIIFTSYQKYVFRRQYI